jgi:hypothetical protein
MDLEEDAIAYQLINWFIPSYCSEFRSKGPKGLGINHIPPLGGLGWEWNYFFSKWRGSPMKFLSFNCRGVVSPSKKLSLKWLVDSNHPDIIFLQETMGMSSYVFSILEYLLNNWSFSSMDTRGRSGEWI